MNTHHVINIHLIIWIELVAQSAKVVTRYEVIIKC